MAKQKLKTDYRYRLAVYRSNKAIYAQIIDDRLGLTLAAASDRDVKSATGSPLDNKTTRAELVGKALAAAAAKKKITKVYFDRGRCKYHGRVKALAEGARQGGLAF